jgi:hypothetical protein
MVLLMAGGRTPAGKLEPREGVDPELKGERRAAGEGTLEIQIPIDTQPIVESSR